MANEDTKLDFTKTAEDIQAILKRDGAKFDIAPSYTISISPATPELPASPAETPSTASPEQAVPGVPAEVTTASEETRV